MSKPKEYKSLAEIVEAKRNGTLPKTFQIVVDDDWAGAYGRSGRAIYEGPCPEDLLIEALSLLGIKAVRP